jgi:hypothetical protein
MAQIIPERCNELAKLIGYGSGYTREVQTLRANGWPIQVSCFSLHAHKMLSFILSECSVPLVLSYTKWLEEPIRMRALRNARDDTEIPICAPSEFRYRRRTVYAWPFIW